MRFPFFKTAWQLIFCQDAQQVHSFLSLRRVKVDIHWNVFYLREEKKAQSANIEALEMHLWIKTEMELCINGATAWGILTARFQQIN